MSLKLWGSLSVLTLILSSCVADKDPLTAGQGAIAATFSANYNVNTATKIDRSGEIAVITPDINDFKVHLMKEDGSYDKKWDSVAEFPGSKSKSTSNPEEGFSTGAYIIETYYGDVEVEGFDKPYFFGKKEFSVYDGETSAVSVVCELANTMVSINYTEAFKNYFSDYSATVHSMGGEYIKFAKSETRAAYVKPGTITMEMSLTKTNGVKSTFSPAQITNALAKTHYRITFDVNGGEVGDAQLLISFDSSTEVEPITIDLSDELMNAPAPTIKPTGYANETPIDILEGDAAPNELKALLTAMSGISVVTLTTSSESLISKGWPAEIDLTKATEAQKTLLTGLGLNVKGVWGNVDKMATVDFTNVIKNLRVTNGNSTHLFTLQVKDKYTKVCETPLTLTVSAPAVELSIAKPSDIFIGQSTTTAIVTYNGTNFEQNIKMKAVNEYGVWADCTTTNVSNVGNIFTVTYNLPPSNESVKVKASYKNGMKESNVVTYTRINPNYAISTDETTVWAKKAVIAFNPDDPTLKSQMTTYATIYIKTSSSQWAKATMVKNTSAGTIDVVGLAPSTPYTVKATLSDSPSNTTFSNEVSFVTEAALDLPNGNFETLASTISIGSINQGGKYSNLTNWAAKYNTTSINVSEPTGWASVNAKTCSLNASSKNTWFMVPSTYSISSAQSGSYAMEIRNVAWDIAGSEPGRDTRGDTQNYSGKAPGFADRSAGKLFLGIYTFDAGSKTESYNEGLSFSARPSRLTGYYKYSNDANDTSEKGVVVVTLLNGDVVIGTGTTPLSAVEEYTAFSVPVIYSVFNQKATSIKVLITSSNHASYTQSTETANIKTTNYLQPAISTGAVLCVDNLSLSYE